MKLPISLPSQTSPPAAEVAPIRTIDEPPVNLRRDLSATLVSATIHFAFLLLLAFWVIPSLVGPENILVSASFGERESIAIDTLDIQTIEPPDVEAPVEQPVEVVEPVTLMALDPVEIQPQKTLSPAGASEPVEKDLVPTQSASSASIEGAVDSVTDALEAKLETGDVLVVWLLDASASLVDDRQRVADRLTPFYERIAARSTDEEHQLESAVVSFGARMNERVAPTRFGEKIVSTVQSIPVDKSGREQVFDAVARCADHYRKARPEAQLVVVIWTDESGDDTAYLENTIAACLRNRASVSVVGPSSVLGADTGLHSYTDPKTGDRYQLPVTRGPDTAMPERIDLGYWYITQIGGRRFGGALPAWVGGQDLEGILCGFSPYALTRLALQTGGTYTIFDRPEDRSPFEFEVMTRYAPRYASISTYQNIVRASPLRRAVMNAVNELAGKKVDAPPMMLYTKSTGHRWFDFTRLYYPPREFQSKLRGSRMRLTRQAARYMTLVDKALTHLSDKDSPDKGLDEFYEAETSPRWRAWYDLTRGRLLATSVRLEEYRLAIEDIARPGGVASTTNFVMLGPSQTQRSEGVFLDRADEARELLWRCVNEHRGTPWEVLAQRELDFALGVAARERSLSPTPGAMVVRQPNLPKF